MKKERHNVGYDHFEHNYIIPDDWLNGYNELRRQLGMKDEDFPDHIKRHLKELKEQRKLIY